MQYIRIAVQSDLYMYTIVVVIGKTERLANHGINTACRVGAVYIHCDMRGQV